MAVTDGPLTQRLGQMIDSIGVFFNMAGNKLDSTIALLGDIKAVLDQIVSPVNLGVGAKIGLSNIDYRLGRLNDATPAVLTYLYEIYAVANKLDDVKAKLDTLNNTATYITRSGDGTPLNRNLQSVADEIFRLGGPLPNHATLFDIYDALGRDPETLSLRQAFFELSGNALGTNETNLRNLAILLTQIRDGVDIAGTPVTNLSQQQMITLLTQIKDRIGTAQNGLSVAELGQVIAECICALNDKIEGPTLPPGEYPTPPPVANCTATEVVMYYGPTSWERVTGYTDDTWWAKPDFVGGATLGFSGIVAAKSSIPIDTGEVPTMRTLPYYEDPANVQHDVPNGSCIILRGTYATIQSLTFPGFEKTGGPGYNIDDLGWGSLVYSFVGKTDGEAYLYTLPGADFCKPFQWISARLDIQGTVVVPDLEIWVVVPAGN